MKIKFIIKGQKVHNVGYRVFLVNKALSLAVDNFNTFNTFINDVQAVIAIMEADAEVIEDYKGFISTTVPEEAGTVTVSAEDYYNAVPPIERVMQGFQMEQMGKGIHILLNMLEKQGQMLDKQDHSLEKQGQMLDKQDQSLEKQDGMIELQKETITTIKLEGEKTRDAITAHLSSEVADIRQEIVHLKSTLARVADKVGVDV